MTPKDQPITYIVCVNCSFPEAVLAFERFGVNTYLCPQCQHVWEARDPAKKHEGA